ncbi:hypothetical protein IQ241_16505 [Romeria aff. gracilis LEGE 07310]|uniref:Uncharacterized protein n=1 Tax=Vasconcelosia minhoensis LEGE 07310 TaxID=915328 RepID=A0A8J7DRM4_9CYAN|nr:hypothetical protein [Romeria gracilis]MBE9078874.1 hypothetical protein [Romeria aff. gracilis LEGE 07310]
MNASLMRKLWSVIEASQNQIILGLDDSRLCQWLLDQLAGDPLFDRNQSAAVSRYIHAKLPLIRDFAQFS